MRNLYSKRIQQYFDGYNKQTDLKNDLYTETTDVIYFVAFLVFPIHITYIYARSGIIVKQRSSQEVQI